jgi:hypothetical protein
MAEVYLGDGLYASFDGFQYCLRAPRGTVDHVVYLDSATMGAFDEFRKGIASANRARTTEHYDNELSKTQRSVPSPVDGKR